MTAALVTHWPYLVASLAAYVVVYAWVMFARMPKGRR